MENLISVGGEFWIDNSDLLTDLTPFENLTSVDSNILIINNALLSNLFGFENIGPNSIDNLTIYENPLLSDCDVVSICEYLIDPNGTIDIHSNATGCNSQGEVELACLTDIKELRNDGILSISPNPLNSTSLIKYNLNHKSPVTIKILDITGQKIKTIVDNVQQQGEQQIVFNTEDLPSGIYFCVLKTNNGIVTKKIIKL